ncbi:MAG TPA: EpsG family protein [Sphingomicrobium sp.]|nr:EpsG family protein [Sphingomicrobium sp.]
MLVYWSLFAYFVTGSLFSKAEERSTSSHVRPMLAVGALAIAILIGFRYEVGADWRQYERMFTYAHFADLGRMLEVGDPGYQLLNWGVEQVGGGLWLVNLVGGLIFAWGLLRFAAAQPDPWLAMVVAIPYLVVVVGMGYSRQALAIGILMAGLASVARNPSILRFALYVTAAALFHKTAVIVFPLVAFAQHRNRFTNFLIMAAASISLYDFFLRDTMQAFVENYIEAEYSSEGAAIRVAMNVVPAMLLLLFRKRFAFSKQQYTLWRNFSLAAVGLVVLLVVLPSSAAVDRMALYIIPLQIAVLTRVAGTILSSSAGKAVIIAYSTAVFFVWLNFAVHAQYWVPYRFYPL